MAESNVQLNTNTTAGARVGTFTRTEGADTVHTQAVAIANPDTGDAISVATEATQQSIVTALGVMNSLVPASYNYISMGYDGSNRLQTVTFKSGGSGGTTVATLTLTYDPTSGNVATVTRA